MSRLLVEGRLLRKDRTFQTWKWRKVFLNEGRLQVFSEKTGAKKSDVALRRAAKVRLRVADEPRPFAFEVMVFSNDADSSSEHHHHVQKIQFAASSEQERQKWTRAFVDQAAAKYDEAYIAITTNKSMDHSKKMERKKSGDEKMETDEICGPIQETSSHISFPPYLVGDDRDLLMGVGPFTRRSGWTDERIMAVAIYIEAEKAQLELVDYSSRSFDSLLGDQNFYDRLIEGKFRKTFVFSSRKRISRSVIIASLYYEIKPRLRSDFNALHQLTAFIEKSLKKAESIIMTVNVDSTIDFKYRGVSYPPILSPELCYAVQGVFFDLGSIQGDAKRGLVERIPTLWGIRADYVKTTVSQKSQSRNSALDEEDHEDDNNVTQKRMTNTSGKENNALQMNTAANSNSGNQNNDADMDEDDEQELIRRKSRNLKVRFGPLLEEHTQTKFEGQLIDGTILIGSLYCNNNTVNYTLGLYVEAASTCEALSAYKGLSVGTFVLDLKFGERFQDGFFSKRVVMKLNHSVEMTEIVDYLFSGQKGHQNQQIFTSEELDTLTEHFINALGGNLLGKEDLLYFSFDPLGALNISRSQLNSNEIKFSDTIGKKMQFFFYGVYFDKLNKHSPSILSTMSGSSGTPTKCSQGPSTNHESMRVSLLFERLPRLLDYASDDLVHTYRDEILMLRENYNRAQPENRVKIGYLYLYVLKDGEIESGSPSPIADYANENSTNAVIDNAATTPTRGVGKKRIKLKKASFKLNEKWSKRFVRLDGCVLAYFTHKKKKKPRELLDLSSCCVKDLSLSEDIFPDIKHVQGPNLIIGIKKPNGDTLALCADDVFEGGDWLDCISAASNTSMIANNNMKNSETTVGSIPSSISSLPSPLESVVSSSLPVNGDNKANNFVSSIEKETGLFRIWLFQDSRNRLIFILITLIVWLISSRP